MNSTLTGIALLGGAFVATRTPWLGARFSARYRGRGQRRPRGQSRLGGSDRPNLKITPREASTLMRLLYSRIRDTKKLTKGEDSIFGRLITFVNESKKK